MDFNLTHSKAEETRFFAFSLEMLIGLFFAKAQKRHALLAASASMLGSWTLDLMVLLNWLCFGLASLYFILGQVKRKVRELGNMRVREADAAKSLSLRRWDFLLAVTSHHSNFMCTDCVSIHSLGSGTSRV